MTLLKANLTSFYASRFPSVSSQCVCLQSCPPYSKAVFWWQGQGGKSVQTRLDSLPSSSRLIPTPHSLSGYSGRGLLNLYCWILKSYRRTKWPEQRTTSLRCSWWMERGAGEGDGGCEKPSNVQVFFTQLPDSQNETCSPLEPVQYGFPWWFSHLLTPPAHSRKVKGSSYWERKRKGKRRGWWFPFPWLYNREELSLNEDQNVDHFMELNILFNNSKKWVCILHLKSHCWTLYY